MNGPLPLVHYSFSDLNQIESQKTVKQYRQQEGSKQKTLKRNFFFFLLTPFIFNFTLVLGVKWIYTPLNLILKVTKGLCSISQNKRLRFKSIHMKSTPSCTLSIGRITYVFHSVVCIFSELEVCIEGWKFKSYWGVKIGKPWGKHMKF